MRKIIALGLCVPLMIYPDAEVVLQKDQMKVELINNNHNHNNHKIEVHNEEDPYDCKRYVGDELKKRMNYLPKPMLIKNLITFSERTRTAYEQSLLPCEAQKLLGELNATDRSQLIQAVGDQGRQFIGALESKVARQKELEEKAKANGSHPLAYGFKFVAALLCPPIGIPLIIFTES
jgi:hypothetical protein